MRTRASRAKIAAGTAIALSLVSPGQASDGTITFTGAVTGNSCMVQVNGTGSDGTVALPVVDATALDDSSAARNTAAGTFFDITLSNCLASQADLPDGAPTRVALYFEAGPNVDSATHGLINAGTSNVEVKLYQASESHIVGTQITPGTAGIGQTASQAVAAVVTQYFYAGYSLTGGVRATAGTVSTAVTYSLIYN
jgi:major type 1 subunit fimbrin (pilin)